MYCTKCGADNGDGAAVCKNCREKLETGADTVAQTMRKRGKRGLFIGITAAVVAVIAIAAVFLFTSNAAPVSGNTNMNINNMGLAVENGGWIYYSNNADEKSIYKIRTDGTGKTKLNSDSSFCINVIGDWIYYLDIQRGRLICRMHTDGTGRETINSNPHAFQLYVYGDWMYYAVLLQGDPYLYRMRTDGTEETALDAMTASFNISDGWIYYLDRADSKKYKMRLDGSDKTELSQDYSILALTDGWGYYNYNDQLSKIRADGTERTKLTDDPARGINAADGWVYYVNINDNFCMYKVRTDGTERTKLNVVRSDFINIAGDWIYYVNADDHNFYRMKTDGSENQLVD